MKGIVSNNKNELEAIDLKIHNYMKQNISNYNAKRLGRIVKNLNDNSFVLMFNDDSRCPLNQLTKNEKTRHIELKIDEWVPKKPLKQKFKKNFRNKK